jgi:Thrombospondin type 1 domain
MKIIDNILTEDDILDILSDYTVIKNRFNIIKSDVVKFSVQLPSNIVTKLESQLGIQFIPEPSTSFFSILYNFLFGIDKSKINVPMRWIKGNSPPHIDHSTTHSFNTTHLVYITDSVGKLVVDGNIYPIKSGTAYSFNEGTEHETIGTGDSVRLLIGPMSEYGNMVGIYAGGDWGNYNAGGQWYNGGGSDNSPPPPDVPSLYVPPPPPPCTYGPWQDTSSCPSCGTDATKTQIRSATDNGANDCNQPTMQTVPCNVPPCPTCNYSEWTTWSACSKPCNGGIQTRTRTQNPVGYIQCGDISQTQPCNTQTCPSCAYSTTGITSNCSVQCGGGTQTITYSLIDANGNDNCASTNIITQSCNTQLCPAIMNVITPSYIEYWNVYLSSNYNSATYFTSSDYNKIDNSKISPYEINAQNAEQYRDNLVVGLFPLTIDIQSITLPYTIYYYYDNPSNGVVKIIKNGMNITSLQLNNNPNNFGNILNAIIFNTNGVASIVHSYLYFLTSDLNTMDYYIYMILSKNPIMLQPQQLLSCTTKNASTCIDNNLGNNMAVAFTVNLKSVNRSSNRLQILGITTDSTGVEKCVFGAWICPNSGSLYLRRADAEGTNGVFSNCKVSLDVGLDCQIFILFNGSSGTYDTYKNGVQVDSFTVTSPPMYTTGKSYVFTSFNNYQTINGTLSNVVFLTSDHRNFAISDLENAIQFMNTSNIFSQYQKTMIEGFSGYSTIPTTNYSSDYASYNTNNEMMIQNTNNRNREYANQKKSEYTFIKTQSQIGMQRDMLGNAPVPLYQDVSDNLRVRAEEQSGVFPRSSSTQWVMSKDDEKDKQKINRRILELQNRKAIMQSESYNDIYANILWTGLVSSIVYFLFVR